MAETYEGDPSRDSTNFWSAYTSQADRHDRTMLDTWINSLNSVLILAALFSISLSIFIIEGQKLLKPNPDDMITSLLQQLITVQLATASSNQSSISLPPVVTPPAFRPSVSAVAINALWFSSLTVSIAAAIGVTIAQQWLSVYWLRVQQNHHTVKRGEMRMFLFAGLVKWKLDDAVEYLPTLLHISLVLFFAGLCIFLWTIDLTVAILVTAIIACFVALYGFITSIPFYDPSSPYGTPLSLLFWNLRFRWVPAFLHLTQRKQSLVPPDATMYQQDLSAYSASLEDRRRALQWVYNAISDDGAFEEFLVSIPRFLALPSGGEAWIAAFPRESSQHIIHPRIEERMALFLALYPSLDIESKKQKVTVCLDALFAIMVAQNNHGTIVHHRRIGFTPFVYSLRNLFNERLGQYLADGRWDHYIPFLKGVCTFALCIHQSPEFERSVKPRPQALDHLDIQAQAAERALLDLDYKRQKLENKVADDLPFEIYCALNDYLATLNSASTCLESFVAQTMRDSLPGAVTRGFPTPFHSWYSCFPQPNYAYDTLRLASTSLQELDYNVYAVNIMAFMRGSRVYPILPELKTPSFMQKKGYTFPNPDGFLRRELQPLALALERLRIDVKVGGNPFTMPVPWYPIESENSFLPMMIVRRPFLMYAAILHEIDSSGPAPTSALFEIIHRLMFSRHSFIPSSHTLQDAEMIISRTFEILYPSPQPATIIPGLRSMPKRAHISNSRSRIFNLVRMARSQTSAEESVGQLESRDPSPISRVSSISPVLPSALIPSIEPTMPTEDAGWQFRDPSPPPGSQVLPTALISTSLEEPTAKDTSSFQNMPFPGPLDPVPPSPNFVIAAEDHNLTISSFKNSPSPGPLMLRRPAEFEELSAGDNKKPISSFKDTPSSGPLLRSVSIGQIFVEPAADHNNAIFSRRNTLSPSVSEELLTEDNDNTSSRQYQLLFFIGVLRMILKWENDIKLTSFDTTAFPLADANIWYLFHHLEGISRTSEDIELIKEAFEIPRARERNANMSNILQAQPFSGNPMLVQSSGQNRSSTSQQEHLFDIRSLIQAILDTRRARLRSQSAT